MAIFYNVPAKQSLQDRKEIFLQLVCLSLSKKVLTGHLIQQRGSEKIISEITLLSCAGSPGQP